MSQLLMRRPSLENLPGMPLLPPEYNLRLCQTEDIAGVAQLMAAAFQDETWTTERVERDLIGAEDVKNTYVIICDNTPVATASVRLDAGRFPGSGYVHWVAAHPEHSGKRLGYIVSLAVLRELAQLGCTDAILETDDHRLSAIVTYRQLGFLPEHRDETHLSRWEAIEAQVRRS
jgi:ribosomal protein S18 acetylase RimI-like enzyme